jgi:hypothetical protein
VILLILIAALTTSFLHGVTENPNVPSSVKEHADLHAALSKAGVSPEVAAEAEEANDHARVDGLRSALSVLALFAIVGLFVARAIPKMPKSAPIS